MNLANTVYNSGAFHAVTSNPRMLPPVRRPSGLPGKRMPLPTRALKPSAKLIEKLVRANKRNLVGRPLHSALRQRDGLSRTSITAAQAGWLVGALAGMGLLGTGISISSIAMTGAGSVVALAAGIGMMRTRRAQSSGAFSIVPLEPEVRRLDAYLDEVSPVLPQSALEKIKRIKETLAHVLPVLGSAQQRGDIPGEELFFAEEMVKRYLPDACRHYADLAAAAKGQVLVVEDRSAQESLDNQLDVLHGRLGRVLDSIAASQASKLAMHEAFIQTKSK